MTKSTLYRPMPMPIHEHQTRKNQLNKRPGEEKQIPRHSNPRYTLHLTLRRNLIDRPKRLKHRSKLVRKNRYLNHTNDRYGREQNRIQQYHTLGGIKSQQKQHSTEKFNDKEKSNNVEKIRHGSRSSRTGIKVLFENVRPVDQDEDEDGEETERSRREDFFAYESTYPTGIFGIEGHDCVWDVGWLQERVGDEEPGGTEEAGDEDETVECRDDVGCDASLFSTPGHAVKLSSIEMVVVVVVVVGVSRHYISKQG
jgi:hypothetical protein